MMIPDYLICEYELPVPEEITDLMLAPPVWDEMEFHTCSFIGSPPLSFDRYTISEDGQLYKEIFKTELVDGEGGPEVREKSEGIERLDYTGEILFSGLHLDKEEDFYLEFKSLFWKGDLKELELEEWEKSDNKHRKEAQKEIQTALKKQREKDDSVINVMMSLLLWPLILTLGLIRYLLRFIVTITWKIQNFFS